MKYTDTPQSFANFIFNNCFMSLSGFKLRENSQYHNTKPYYSFSSAELYEFFITHVV